MHIGIINRRAPKALDLIIQSALFIGRKAKSVAKKFTGNGYSGYDLENRSNNFPCFECSVIRGWLADQGQPRTNGRDSAGKLPPLYKRIGAAQTELAWAVPQC